MGPVLGVLLGPHDDVGGRLLVGAVLGHDVRTTMVHYLCVFWPAVARFLIAPPPSYPSPTLSLSEFFLFILLCPALPLLLCATNEALGHHVPVSQGFVFRSGRRCHCSGRSARSTPPHQPCLLQGLRLPHLRYAPRLVPYQDVPYYLILWYV